MLVELETHHIILILTGLNLVVGVARLFVDCRQKRHLEWLVEMLEKHVAQNYA